MSRASASDRATPIPRVALINLINLIGVGARSLRVDAAIGFRARKVVRATGAYCGWMRQSVFARACA